MWKGMTRLLLLGLALLLAGCASTHYGVAEESWQVMSEPERQEARRQYNERRTAEANARAAREQRLQVERQAELLQLEADLEERRNQAALIYRGEYGQFGDLLRVTIHDGRMNLAGHHRSYRKTQFLIAAGDVKRVPVVFDDRRANGKSLDLHVSYQDGRLGIDTDQYGRKTNTAFNLTYQDNWRELQVFSGVKSRGRLALLGATVEVEAINLPGHHQPVAVVAPPPVQKVVVNKTIVRQTVVNKTQVVNRVNNRTVNNNQSNVQNVTKVSNRTNIDNRNTVNNNQKITNNNQKIVKNSNNVVNKDKKVVTKRPTAKSEQLIEKDDDEDTEKKEIQKKASRQKQKKTNRKAAKHKPKKAHKYSKLLLNISGGELRNGDEMMALLPGEYKFKAGETRKIAVKTVNGKTVKLWVRCDPHALLFSEDDKFKTNVRKLGWKQDWNKGKYHRVVFDQSSSWRVMKMTVKTES